MPRVDPDLIERTPFGERLYKARIHAKLSQRALGERVGMGQSALAEAEKTGQGSTFTPQLARETGVRVEWLAEGKGPMLDTSEVPGQARTVASEQVAHRLVGTDGAQDYRTVALSLAASLESAGIELSVKQFVDLLEATYEKLRR